LSGRGDNAKDEISRLLEDFGEGFTPIPNVLLDWIVPVLTEGESRVLSYICRRTFGFGKQWDKISLSQLCDGVTSRSGVQLDLGTGMSRQGVLNAIAGLQDKGLLIVVPGGGRSQVSEYKIHLSQEAWDRIDTLGMTPRENVNAVDPLRKRPTRQFPPAKVSDRGAQKGQQPTGKKVNTEEKFGPEKVYAVDPQKKELLQQGRDTRESTNILFLFNLSPRRRRPRRGA